MIIEFSWDLFVEFWNIDTWGYTEDIQNTDC